ncbi:2-hydroxyacid dehydrogenase [Streptomyces sp. NPDC008238]
MDGPKNVLAVVAPHVGGRRIGAALAGLLEGRAAVTVVESADEDPDALAAAHVIMTALAPVTAGHLARAPVLELVQCTSHGHEHVDVAAARARGVPVCTIGSSGVETQSVAEQAFALMLALAKRIVPGHEALSRGEWPLPDLQRSLTGLDGRVLGVIGFGAIGQAVARRAAAFGMSVLYTSRGPVPAATERLLGARGAPLEELLAGADYVSVHVPLSDATRHLLDAPRLALLKPTAFLVNTARGAVVDQDALADALEAGRLAGAGLDVFDPEPPAAGTRLLRAPNVVLSPHAGGATRDTLVRIAQAAVRNVVDFLDSRPPRDVVTAAEA